MNVPAALLRTECEVELHTCEKVMEILERGNQLHSGDTVLLMSLLSTVGVVLAAVWAFVIPPLIICCMYNVDATPTNLGLMTLWLAPVVLIWIFLATFITFHLFPQTTCYKLAAIGLPEEDMLEGLEKTCDECYPTSHLNFTQLAASWSGVVSWPPKMYLTMHVFFCVAFLVSLLTLLYIWHTRKCHQAGRTTRPWFRQRPRYDVADYFQPGPEQSPASGRGTVTPSDGMGVRSARGVGVASNAPPVAESVESYTNIPSGKMDLEQAADNCAICCEQLDCRRTMQLPCGHFFHRSCAVEWLNRALRPTCPLCGTLVPPKTSAHTVPPPVVSVGT